MKGKYFFTSRLFVFLVILGIQICFALVFLYWFSDLSPVIEGILFACSLLLVLYIINKRQDPAYKVVWIIPILILPIAGFLLYFFFSQGRIRRRDRQYAMESYRAAASCLNDEDGICRLIEKKQEDPLRLISYIRKTRQYPAFTNTRTQYFPMGELFFDRFLKELEQAERYIYMEFFMIKQGRMWDSILDVLRRKAKAGVEVRLIYDDLGCAGHLEKQYAAELGKQGIKCVVFNKLNPVLASMFNNRDHRKIAILDGKTAFVCGTNLADEYINAERKYGIWKDACLMMKGDAAWGFLIIFLQTWDLITKKKTDVSYLQPEKDEQKADGLVQPYADSPLDEVRLAENIFLSLIHGARRYLYITTPYLVLNSALKTAFATAAGKGVDVRIITPHIPDKKAVFLVTRANYRELLENGVKIYEYTPGFIHAKTYTCDDEYAVVGTINTDYRSLFLNFECAALLYKNSAIKEMREDFLQTAKQCEQVTLEKTNAVPWPVRLAQSVMNAFAPML